MQLTIDLATIIRMHILHACHSERRCIIRCRLADLEPVPCMVHGYCGAYPFESSAIHYTGRLSAGGAVNADSIFLHFPEPKSQGVREARSAVGMIEKNRIVRRDGIERFFIRKLRIFPSAPNQPATFR